MRAPVVAQLFYKCGLLTKYEVKIYYLLTESVVITGKSQAEALMY